MSKQKNDNSRKVPKKLKRPAAPLKDVGNSDSLPLEEELDDVPRSTNGSDSDSRKSLLYLEDEPTQDFSGGMSESIERFQSDLNKTMIAKRRKVEQLTQESTKSITKKALEIHKIRSTERKRLFDEFRTQQYAVINQLESEVEKLKDSNEKLKVNLKSIQVNLKSNLQVNLKSILQKFIIQQQQIGIVNGQLLKALEDIREAFCKVRIKLEENRVQQYSAVHNELKREMDVLRKKILMELQQQ